MDVSDLKIWGYVDHQQSSCDRGHGDTLISGSLDKTLQFAIFVTFCHHGHDTCGAIFQDGSSDGMSSGKVTLLHNKRQLLVTVLSSPRHFLDDAAAARLASVPWYPLPSYSGSYIEVSYRSYRKRSEKLEVFLEGHILPHLIFFGASPWFQPEVFQDRSRLGCDLVRDFQDRQPFTLAPLTPAWHVWQGIDPTEPDHAAQHDFSWPKNTWMLIVMLQPAATTVMCRSF